MGVSVGGNDHSLAPGRRGGSCGGGEPVGLCAPGGYDAPLGFLVTAMAEGAGPRTPAQEPRRVRRGTLVIKVSYSGATLRALTRNRHRNVTKGLFTNTADRSCRISDLPTIVLHSLARPSQRCPPGCEASTPACASICSWPPSTCWARGLAPSGGTAMS